MGNMKKGVDVSSGVSLGSIFLSNKGFEEEVPLLSLGSRGRRRWSSSAAGKESVLGREVTQEELVKRDTPLGSLRRACFQCCGLVGPDVPLLRQRCVCAAPSRRGVQTADVDCATPGPCSLDGFSPTVRS